MDDYQMNQWKIRGIHGVIALLISSLACRPVLTVGWGEVFILIVILLLVLGVPLLRVWRARSQSDTSDGNDEQD